ncbi:MAG: MerC domain-containing protein [Thermonemataceae bacterium]
MQTTKKLPSSSTKNTSTTNKIALSLPLLCAIHCAIMPFFITSLPFLGLEFVAMEVIEWVVLLISLGYALYILIKDRKRHKQSTALYLLLVGFTFMFVAHSWHHFTVVLSIIGASIILLAYLFNWRALRSSKSCRLPA